MRMTGDQENQKLAKERETNEIVRVIMKKKTVV